tara:strand:+ start:228 stop:482 length:255 start_codon:yes stop_codon:yes gene_type:complete
MIGFDPDICELCGGFGDCADGDCDDRLHQVILGPTQKVEIDKHQLFHILEILDYLRENNDLNRTDEALYQGLSDIRLGLMLGAR